MQVQELMTKTIKSVLPDTSIREAARTMKEEDIGTLAVVENDELVGIITDRDICCRCVGSDLDPTITKVWEVMSKDVSKCFSDQDIADAAKLMEDKHIRRIAVFDRKNKMAGLLSVDDLARGSYNLAGEVLASATSYH